MAVVGSSGGGVRWGEALYTIQESTNTYQQCAVPVSNITQSSNQSFFLEESSNRTDGIVNLP